MGPGIHYLKMRIGLDLRPFLRDETGIGVYFRNLLSSLSAIDESNRYCLFSASRKDRFPKDRLPGFSNRILRDMPWPTRIVDWAWSRLGVPTLDALFRERIDLTHSPTPLILPTRGRRIVTAHDLFFLDFPDLTDDHTRTFFTRRAPGALRRADGVIAVSDYVRRRLVENVGVENRRVRVIHHGTDPAFRRVVSRNRLTALRARYGLPERFLLFVGASEPRKNLPMLVRSLNLLSKPVKAVPLVIVGRKGSDHARVLETVTREGAEDRVLWLNYCPSSDLPGIYRLAALLVIPSLCEGFGLPVLEAMAAGLPVAAARTAALPEIAGGAARYFDPGDPHDMARCLGEVLEDRDLRRQMIEAGKKRSSEFDWDRTARETLAFYRDVAGEGGT